MCGTSFRNFSEIKSGDFVRSGIIRGGGPGKNVTAYYVSCYVVRTNSNSNGEWLLVGENDDPFELDYNKSPLSVKAFFERIAEQTAPGSYAWIALDAKTPTVVGNLGDLEFPSNSIESTFKQLQSDFQNRLIVTLPCGGKTKETDGGKETIPHQESWMAPEFGNSVFGHFFLQGVFTGFGKQEPIVTLESFEENLTEKIKQWVELHRFAVQRPLFLMSEDTRKQKARIKLFEITGVHSQDFAPKRLSRDQISGKFKDLDTLWKNFETLRSYHRWSPLAYAEIESQLLQMEDLAECEEPGKSKSSNWAGLVNETKTKIELLKSKIKFTRNVSLIEARSYGRIFSDLPITNFTNILKESKAAGPNWLKNPDVWPWRMKPETDSDLTAARSRDDKCFLVWDVFQRFAQADEASGWSKVFSRENLESALKYVGPTKGETPEWLEIQLLKIIHDEIDFPNDSSKSSLVPEAIARTLATFSTLQDISTSPNHETSWWMDRQLVELDKKFLVAFDLLVANQFDKCIQGIQGFKNDLESRRQFRDELELAMSCRDDAFQIAPHALASLMRLYRHRADTTLAPDEIYKTHLEYLANHLGLAVAKAQMELVGTRPVVVSWVVEPASRLK